MNEGIPLPLLRPHSCEVAVPGNPKTRYPDLTILDELHIPLIERRNTITRQMPPPRVWSWVQVGTLVAGEYQFNTFRDREIILSPTFPTLSLTAAQILH
jgi:hypothetical protein